MQKPEQQVMQEFPALLTPCQHTMESCPEVWRLELGIDKDCCFDVVQKLLGPAGDHLEQVNSRLKGAQVWLSGHGLCSGACPAFDSEAGPLAICVSATSGPSFDMAMECVHKLLDVVLGDFPEINNEVDAQLKKSKAHQSGCQVLRQTLALANLL